MSRVQALVFEAFNELPVKANKSGIYLRLTVSYGRASDCRLAPMTQPSAPGYDLAIAVVALDTDYSVSVESVKLAALATDLVFDQTQALSYTGSWLDCRKYLVDCLENILTDGYRLKVKEFSCYQNPFGQITFSRDNSARVKLGILTWLFRPIDTALKNFVHQVASQAVLVAPIDSAISLWFKPDDQTDYKIIFTVAQAEEDYFEVVVTDKTSSSVKSKKATVYGQDSVVEFIENYVSRKHAFAFNSLSVYFGYSTFGKIHDN